MASYPTLVKSFSTKATNDVIEAPFFNEPQDEIIAIENGLLTGLAHDLLPDADGTRKLGSAAKSWDGSEIINLNASNLASGTIPAARIATPVVQTTTLTGTQNDLALSAGVSVLRCNNATALTITGFAAGYAGQQLIVEAVGAGDVFLKPQNAGSAASARLLNLVSSGDTPLSNAGALQGGSALYVYDTVVSLWRLVHHAQGAMISPAFSAGNFTGSGGWTVGSGDITTMGYVVRDRFITVFWYMGSTTVVTGTNLLIGNGAWGGFTANKTILNPMGYNDAGSGNAAGFAQVSAAGTTIILIRAAGASWSNATDTTGVFGEITFEVT